MAVTASGNWGQHSDLHKLWRKQLSPGALKKKQEWATSDNPHQTSLHSLQFSTLCSYKSGTDFPYGNFSLQTRRNLLLWECFQFMNYKASDSTDGKKGLRDTRSLNQPPPTFLSSGISQWLRQEVADEGGRHICSYANSLVIYSLKSTFLQKQAPVFNLSRCVCHIVTLPPPLPPPVTFDSVSHFQSHLTE